MHSATNTIGEYVEMRTVHLHNDETRYTLVVRYKGAHVTLTYDTYAQALKALRSIAAR